MTNDAASVLVKNVPAPLTEEEVNHHKEFLKKWGINNEQDLHEFHSKLNAYFKEQIK